MVRVEVWKPRRHKTLGVLIGLGIGTAVGFATRPDPPPARDPDECVPQPGDIAPFDVMLSLFCSMATAGADAIEESERQIWPVFGALIGAAAGALVGHMVDTGDWVPAFVPQVSAGDPRLDLSWTLRTSR